MKNKKQIIIIGVILTIIIMLVVFLLLFFFRNENKVYEKLPGDFILVLNSEELEVYSKITYQDLIKDSSGKLINKSKKINTKELGKQEISLLFEYKEKKYSHKIEVSVVDQNEPIILGSTSKTVNLGYDKNLCDLFMIADNYDKKPSCIVEGEYDVNVIGSYFLIMNVVDSSGNQFKQEFTLKVRAESNQSTEQTPTYISFESILEKYKTDETEIGIDVSKWQKEIDMNQVRDAGATFVIMRIGCQAGKDYDIEKDAYFEQNFKNAKEAGLKVGVYFYTTATTVKEAKEQARWITEQLGDEKIDFPIVFDWENWNYWNNYNLSLYDINTIADTFIKEVTKEKYEGMLYGSKYYLENVFYNNDTHSVWLAHYTTNLIESSYEGKYLLWQLTDKAKIDGISTTVDVNVYYKE